MSTSFRREPTAPPGEHLSGRRAAVVIFSHYPGDARPRRAAEALARSGMAVEVICLRGSDAGSGDQVLNGVSMRMLPIRHRRGGRIGYVWQYASFLVAAFLILGWRSLFRRYDLVHVHNMPDLLVFAALVPKLRGAKVVLDLHDPMPELLTSVFGCGYDGGLARLLRRFERWSTRFADDVITVNAACKQLFASRSCRAAKIHVIMNVPDPAIFPFQPVGAASRRAPSPRCVLMYHGSLVERLGLDLAVAALAIVKAAIPAAELRIFGRRTAFLDRVLSSPAAVALGDAIRYLGERSLEQIGGEIRQCDIGVVPNRRCRFTDLATPTRVFEYLSQGRPVIAPRTRGILDYFGPKDIFYFDAGDAAGMARQIVRIHARPHVALATVRRGQAVCQLHGWEREQTRFLLVVARLLARQKPVAALPESLVRA